MALLRSQRTATMVVGSLFQRTRSSFASKCYSNFVVKENDVKKSVFISQSTNIFSNLALEEWLFRNFDFKRHHVLMLWRNTPSIVVGRTQNPWLETNVSNIASGVELARRSTDGGTIYNDLGNLNLTFFTPVEKYDKKYNLEIITRGIFREYGLKVNISPKEDLVLRNFKHVSGNAAKLGRPNSYHHCTLLVQTNKSDLSQNLQKQERQLNTCLDTKRVMNLCEENPKVSVDGVLEAIGWEFLRTAAFSIQDGGLSLAHKQNGFQMVNPTDAWFPGLGQIKKEFSSWDWCYGETPKFTVSHALHHNSDLHVLLNVDKGIIQNANISSGEFGGIVKDLIGSKYSTDAIDKLESFIGEYRQKEVMTSI